MQKGKKREQLKKGRCGRLLSILTRNSSNLHMHDGMLNLKFLLLLLFYYNHNHNRRDVAATAATNVFCLQFFYSQKVGTVCEGGLMMFEGRVLCVRGASTFALTKKVEITKWLS